MKMSQEKKKRKTHMRTTSLQILKNTKMSYIPTHRISKNSIPFVEENDNYEGQKSSGKKKTCLICFDKSPDSVIMECGHGGYFI